MLLLGTAEQVSLAARAARDMVAGMPVRTLELVVSLRGFIRQALDLDLEPIPPSLGIPEQGPLRTVSSGGKGGCGGKDGGSGRGGSGGGGGMGGAAGGSGLGLGAGLGLGGLGRDEAGPDEQG
ncbi:hypothetical protein [Myxococcus fulvus]|uniref:hypothetical protein n=1 Tax=Myxococcus fulvus TaxID=33 RepID=UPI001C3FB211|nr:hypothetical protein [Myxococcus fulvus]